MVKLEPFSWQVVVTSKEFLSAMAGAFFGAVVAFALGVWATWRQAVAARRSAGNMAILALGEMYSLLKLVDGSLIAAGATRAQEHGVAQPLYFHYPPLVNLPERAFELDVASVGYLVDSHGPDILNRLLAAESVFASQMLLVRKHAELHIEFQRRMAAIDPTGQVQMTLAQMEQSVGKDLMLQLRHVMEALIQDIPRGMQDILVASKQLRDVLQFHFPMSTFIKFIPTNAGTIAGTPMVSVKPALWRRAGRALRIAIDKLWGPKWPGGE